MLLRLVPRSFGRVMQQVNRIYLKMSMVFLQPLHPHLSHDPFPSLRSLDLSSRVTLFRAPRPTSKQKQRRARCYDWEGSFKLNLLTSPLVAIAHDHFRHAIVGHCKRHTERSNSFRIKPKKRGTIFCMMPQLYFHKL